MSRRLELGRTRRTIESAEVSSLKGMLAAHVVHRPRFSSFR